jgi:hypothetical protein
VCHDARQAETAAPSWMSANVIRGGAGWVVHRASMSPDDACFCGNVSWPVMCPRAAAMAPSIHLRL